MLDQFMGLRKGIHVNFVILPADVHQVSITNNHKAFGRLFVVEKTSEIGKYATGKIYSGHMFFPIKILFKGNYNAINDKPGKSSSVWRNQEFLLMAAALRMH